MHHLNGQQQHDKPGQPEPPGLSQVQPQRSHQRQQHGLELPHGPNVGKAAEQNPGIQLTESADEGREIGKQELVAEEPSQHDQPPDSGTANPLRTDGNIEGEQHQAGEYRPLLERPGKIIRKKGGKNTQPESQQ
ncbi:TPA: hypothetical protein ACKP0D_006081 [Pseudomonas aeruginosa]